MKKTKVTCTCHEENCTVKIYTEAIQTFLAYDIKEIRIRIEMSKKIFLGDKAIRQQTEYEKWYINYRAYSVTLTIMQADTQKLQAVDMWIKKIEKHIQLIKITNKELPKRVMREGIG